MSRALCRQTGKPWLQHFLTHMGHIGFAATSDPCLRFFPCPCFHFASPHPCLLSLLPPYLLVPALPALACPCPHLKYSWRANLSQSVNPASSPASAREAKGSLFSKARNLCRLNMALKSRLLCGRVRLRSLQRRREGMWMEGAGQIELALRRRLHWGCVRFRSLQGREEICGWKGQGRFNTAWHGMARLGRVRGGGRVRV